jgi:hypothetical protein
LKAPRPNVMILAKAMRVFAPTMISLKGKAMMCQWKMKWIVDYVLKTR